MKYNVIQPRLYVSTYRKYHEGSIIKGTWVKILDYNDIDELYDACHKLHSDEHDPELMFPDYENIPNGLVNESWISNNIFDVLETLQNIDELASPFLIWCENFHYSLADEDISSLISMFTEQYQGAYNGTIDFAYEYVEQNIVLDENLKFYFDYEAFARDLFLGDYWFSDGYVFLNY